METFVGVLAVAVVGAVFGFAAKYMADAKADKEWWRDKAMPMFERQVEALERLWHLTKDECELLDEILQEVRRPE